MTVLGKGLVEQETAEVLVPSGALVEVVLVVAGRLDLVLDEAEGLGWSRMPSVACICS